MYICIQAASLHKLTLYTIAPFFKVKTNWQLLSCARSEKVSEREREKVREG